MTDNRVLLNQDGLESVFVNRSDGLAISEIKKLGIQQIIISTERNPIVLKRAEKLELICFNDIEDKLVVLKKFMDENKYLPENSAFIGNDINDMDVMIFVANSICPADAHPEIKRIADYISIARGGEGVIREIYDHINNNDRFTTR